MITANNLSSRGLILLGLALGCLSGCRHSGALTMSGSGKHTKIRPDQAAEVHVALGRSLEKRGQVGPALAAYREAVKRDPHRPDPYVRMAILYDQEGKFEQSAALYRKAIEESPGSPEIFCDMGYSFYLQRRWDEAEMNLRQALALRPDLHKAHNNLGLVLAQTERPDEALAEFRKAGCNEAEAHVNLAFALTLGRNWEEAGQHYQFALAANPSSERARSGLRELQSLVAKAQGIASTFSGSDEPKGPPGDGVASTGTGQPSRPKEMTGGPSRQLLERPVVDQRVQPMSFSPGMQVPPQPSRGEVPRMSNTRPQVSPYLPSKGWPAGGAKPGAAEVQIVGAGPAASASAAPADASQPRDPKEPHDRAQHPAPDRGMPEEVEIIWRPVQ